MEDFEHFNGEVVLLDGDGIGGHVFGDGKVVDVRTFLVKSNEVTMGEDASKRLIGGGDDGGSGSALKHLEDGFLDGGAVFDEGELFVGPHDIGDFGKEMFAQVTARVEFGKVISFESSFFEEDHGEGVAEGEGIGGAGSGG